MTDSPPDPLVIAHLTDPHLPLGRPSFAEAIGKRGLSWFNWLRKRRYLHRAEITRMVVDDMLSTKHDFIAMTGDLVNFSLEEEFAGGAEWLARLGPPERVGVIPGNHEAMVRGFESRMARHWGPYLAGDDGKPGFPWLRRRGRVALIGVSSGVVTPPFMASGRIGAAQAGRLGQILRETGAEGLCRVVMVHHPPTGIIQWRKALHDRGLFQKVLAEAGAELVLHGHTHRADLSWIDTPRGRVPVIGAPASGMAPGPGRDAGAWRRLELSRDNEGWRLELHERRAERQGGIVDGPRLSFRLPLADIAGAPPDE